MNILLNGQPHTLTSSTTIEQLIEQLELTEKRIAVEVNLDIIPRSQHAAHKLQENDKVEVVQAIGGGQN